MGGLLAEQGEVIGATVGQTGAIGLSQHRDRLGQHDLGALELARSHGRHLLAPEAIRIGMKDETAQQERRHADQNGDADGGRQKEVASSQEVTRTKRFGR